MGGVGDADGRLAWVDIAKGICILLVVMMHSVIGTGTALGGEGFLHPVVAFAKPFRIPDFFLLSGLFLGRVNSARIHRESTNKEHKFTKPPQSIASHTIHLCCCHCPLLHQPCPHSLS